MPNVVTGEEREQRIMRESLVNILKFSRERLLHEINVDENFWTRLVNNGTLTNEHADKCKSHPTNAAKLETLLDMMERRDDPCFQKFCDALRVSNPDVVSHYLEDTRPLPPLLAQPETDQYIELNLNDHLETLRNENAELQRKLELEIPKYSELEAENTLMQNKLEEAKRKVQRCQNELKKNEENYESNGTELASEKVLVEELEKQKEVLDAEVNKLISELKEKKRRKKSLEEEISSKTLENKKLGKQISFHRDHWSSLGSRSRDDGD